MSRRVARSWRNLAVLLFSLPLRVPLALTAWGLAKVGACAEMVWLNINSFLPGLEDDAEHAHRGQKKRLAKTVEGYKSSTQRAIPKPKEPTP